MSETQKIQKMLENLNAKGEEEFLTYLRQNSWKIPDMKDSMIKYDWSIMSAICWLEFDESYTCNSPGRKEPDDIVKELIKYGFSVNKLEGEQYCPLWCALYQGNSKCARVLVEAGADINVVDGLVSKNESPLFLGVTRHNWDMVDFLLGKGANPNLYPEGSGRNLQSLAKWKDDKNLDAVLRKHNLFMEPVKVKKYYDLTYKTLYYRDSCDIIFSNGTKIGATVSPQAALEKKIAGIISEGYTLEGSDVGRTSGSFRFSRME